MNEIGKLIQALRKERKMSQGELGDLIGCSKQTVSNYENGRRRPTFEVLEAICDIFNVPRAYFFTEEEKRAELQKIYSDPSYKYEVRPNYGTYRIGVINTGNVSEMRNKLHELVDQFEDDDILRMVDITLRFKR